MILKTVKMEYGSGSVKYEFLLSLYYAQHLSKYLSKDRTNKDSLLTRLVVPKDHTSS